MTLPDGFQDWLDALNGRLDKGAVEYGDKSMDRRPIDVAGEVLEEQIDQPGWLFVLWAKAARTHRVFHALRTTLATDGVGRTPKQVQAEINRRLRHTFLRRVTARVMGQTLPEIDATGRSAAMCEIETLAAELWQQWAALRARLPRIAKLVHHCVPPEDYSARGRRGLPVDTRSSD